MRLKTVILVLIAGCLVASLAIFLGPKRSPSLESPPINASEPTNGPEMQTQLIAQAPAVDNFSGAKTQPSAEVPVDSTAQMSVNSPGAAETAHDGYVASWISALEDLGAADDPASLETILLELNNGEPEIRKAAIQAAMQFGSREAIPRLLEAATETQDPQEKLEIQAAIEFLKLPPVTEVLRQTVKGSASAANTSDGR